MNCIKSLPAIITPLPFVIPTQEGSRLIAIMVSAFNLSFPLFALMQKNGGQHKSLRVCPASAQQHSNTLVSVNQLMCHLTVSMP
jgi:hypothetical protein